MSTSTLQNSKWASKSSSSRSTFTPAHYNDDNRYISSTAAAASNIPSTNAPPPSTNSNINPNIRSRSVSPSKLPSVNLPPSHLAKSTPTRSQLDLQSRQLSFHRYTLLLRRLKWKSSSLFFSFHRVFRHIANENLSSSSDPTQQKSYMNELDYPMSSLEAETMFKTDFFEYYVLLERVLVHLLGVWGLIVSAGYARDLAGVDGDGVRSGAADGNILLDETARGSILGDSRSFTGHKHRYHANVLSALDTPDATPLHQILGAGRVRDYLGIAKEFRNRWKDAEEKEKNEVDDGLIGSRYERLLRDLKLEAMLGEIAGAVERCKGLAEVELKRVGDQVVMESMRDGNGSGDRGTGQAGLVVADMEMMEYDERPWGVVDDAMEMD